MEEREMDLLRTFLIPYGYDQLVAAGMRLAPAPYPFDTGDGFSPGSLEFRADTIASADGDLVVLLSQTGKLLALGATATTLEPSGLIAFSFENPDFDPRAAVHRLSRADGRRVSTERYTLFVEQHPMLDALVAREERPQAPRGLTALDALQYAGYARHLYGDDDRDADALDGFA